MTSTREHLLDFIRQLRAAEVRISPAESIDAMNAVAVAGFERERLREALSAALIKDEADRAVFDAVFTSFFGSRGESEEQGRRAGLSSEALIGRGRGESAPATEHSKPSLERSVGKTHPAAQKKPEALRDREKSE